MGLRGKSVFQAAPRCHGGTRVGGVGFSHSGLLAVCAVDVKPVRAPCSGTHGRNGSESPFARCGSDISSAAAVHGLCGVLCRLCVCDCGAPCRAIGFDVARWSRPWATAAWLFLTLGIALGSWWAYYELGWGGWWFWDPVENSSFVPWLVGTALIHSLAVTEKRASFKNWTVLLAISTFALSLLGAFLVRSGVLTSVHAFATDPRRGVFLLMLFAVVVG